MIDSYYTINPHDYSHDSFNFVGIPSLQEHIILNDNCATIETRINGQRFECNTCVLCGKFTTGHKIKVHIHNKQGALMIIKLSQFALYHLTDRPIESLTDTVASLNVLDKLKVPKENSLEDNFSALNQRLIIADEDNALKTTIEIMDHIKKYCTDGDQVSMKLTSEKFGLSERTIRRYFKKYIGINFNDLLITMKRKKMMELLYHNQYDALAVQQNGYYDQSHFIRDFKNIFGISPGKYIEYIQTIKKNDPDLAKFFYWCNIE